jgi:DNA-binding GntR family transcriptional regulator
VPVPDPVVPLSRRSARDEVFEHICSWIEERELRPGERIRDHEIAERLGVSRTPVREALQMLEQLGAVETVAGRHTRVRDLDPEEAEQVYTPLGALLAVAAELAIDRLTDDDLAEMATANERLLEATLGGDALGARVADDAFHAVLVRRADNPYLERALEPLLLHQRWLDGLYFSHAQLARASYEDHVAILAALRQGDRDAAAAATRANAARSHTR